MSESSFIRIIVPAASVKLGTVANFVDPVPLIRRVTWRKRLEEYQLVPGRLSHESDHL